MRLLAWRLLLQLLQSLRCVDGSDQCPGSQGTEGLVLCRDLSESRVPLVPLAPELRFRQGESPRDLREVLWPRPRTVALRHQGHDVNPGPTRHIQPLRVDPCNLAFNLSVPAGAQRFSLMFFF